MLVFDTSTIQRLKNPRVKIEDKLYLFVRYIEEKYQFTKTPNHWEDKFGGMDEKERIFYKLWLWICYAEWETLVQPIPEFEAVYGPKLKRQLIEYLDTPNKGDENLDAFFTVDGPAAKILLDWGLKEIKSNYIISDLS